MLFQGSVCVFKAYLCSSVVTAIFTQKHIKKQFVQDYYSCKLLIISPTNPQTKAETAVVTVYWPAKQQSVSSTEFTDFFSVLLLMKFDNILVVGGF